MSEMESVSLTLPEKPRGRPPKSYYEQLDQFADDLQRLNRRLDFSMSARGWAYYLENEGLITKSEFDYVSRLINNCRKDGRLPLDFTAKDDARVFQSAGDPTDTDPERYVRNVINRHLLNPTASASFWQSQDYYIQVLVEKVDLQELFAPLCRQYNIPIATSKGWSSIRQRGELIAKFDHWERQGLQPVLLYCGDFDPAGMRISDTLRKNLADLEEAKIPTVPGVDYPYITGWTPDRLIIDRFGLNAEFIAEQGLTWIDNLETGSGKNLASPSHPDHEKPYVQDWLETYGARKVEANALVTEPDAGKRLFRQTVERYLGEDPSADRKRRRSELEKEIKLDFPRRGSMTRRSAMSWPSSTPRVDLIWFEAPQSWSRPRPSPLPTSGCEPDLYATSLIDSV